MLQNIRDNVQGLVAKIIIGLIIVPFALFGVDSLIGNNGEVNVAEINGEEISQTELQNAVNVKKRQLVSSLGDQLDPTLLDDARLRGPVIKQIITKRLTLQLARDLGISVSPTIIDQKIITIPEFQSEGKFSPALFENVLRSNGYTPGYFKKIFTEDTVASQLRIGIAGSNFVSDAELSDLVRIVQQKRSYRYLTIPVQQAIDKVVVKPEEVKAFYDENIDQFQQPEKVQLSFIEIKQQDFYEPVSEKDLRDAYELEVADFNRSSMARERRASHILLEIKEDRDEAATLALANSLRQRIQEGEDFAALAREFSDDPGSAVEGGDVGFTSGDTFPAQFEEALFALEINDVSNPVTTDAGIHLILATEIKAAEAPTFEERKVAIEKNLQQKLSEARFVSALEDLRDQVFNAENLQDPAKEMGLVVKNTDWISQTTATGIFAKPQVLSAIFSEDVLKDGNNSEVIELANDHYVVLRVKEYVPQQPIPFENISLTIEHDLQQQKATELLTAQAKSAIDKISTGVSLESFAEENNYTWQVELSVARNAAEPNRDVLAKAFAMTAPADGESRYDTQTLPNGDVVIVQLNKVTDGSLDELDANQKRQMAAQLGQEFADKDLHGLVETLYKNADIKIF